MGTIDKFRIDSHKLMFHPLRVAQWLAGENVYPLYVEISPTGACNQRCTFCALDYVGYPARSLDTVLLMERLSEMGRLGVKSVMFGGEGEPLLHPDLAKIVNHARSAGIDVALTTNGTLLHGDLFRQMAASMSWVKVSINAGSAATYAKVHQTSAQQFETVLGNLAQAVAIRKELGSTCIIGAQMVLLPENVAEMDILAKQVKKIGLDYLVVKPYSRHHFSRAREYDLFDSSPYLESADRLHSLDDDCFKYIFRGNAFHKAGSPNIGSERCLALPFWTYIDSGGSVWGCSSHMGDERFCFGTVREQGFEKIWNGARRCSLMSAMTDDFDNAGCRTNCRMSEINCYLRELLHPAPHVNFI